MNTTPAPTTATPDTTAETTPTTFAAPIAPPVAVAPVVPAETVEIQTIIDGLRKTYTALEGSTDKTSKAYGSARRKLMEGSVKRSKVKLISVVSSTFVNTIDSITTLLRSITTGNAIRPREDGCIAYEFLLPPNYVGYTPVVRFQDIYELIKKPAHELRNSVMFFNRYDGDHNFICTEHYAPELDPVRTGIVTFVMEPKTNMLVEWFAGRDISLYGPRSQWVQLGVDLVGGYGSHSRRGTLVKYAPK